MTVSDQLRRWFPFPKTRGDRVVYVIVAIAAANFLSFAAISSFIGGDALNGKYEAGHYFLNNHGRLTEVSESVFNYSKWHARSLFLTHPLAILAGLVAAASKKWSL
ncbi:hypothetical protein [Terrarubrum flagellatum]|uniref:hypothetical protein n=1 Tax=Terrirubrum flagellatum TaxID=2895980 RepID=UPI00314568B5